uniref:Uncharacterized protein n=1 Tax=Candidatus Nitrotoga fabula TaxID=2182327 RepID=A0A2X0SPS4_9PROT|nr:protein of unknown function [Candidatus Nitrotoga fabula]
MYQKIILNLPWQLHAKVVQLGFQVLNSGK